MFSPAQMTGSPRGNGLAMTSFQATSATAPGNTARPTTVHQDDAAGPPSLSHRQPSPQHPSASVNQRPAVHAILQQQHSFRSQQTVNPFNGYTPRAQQPATTRCTSTLELLPRLQAAVSDPQMKSALSGWALPRVILLEQACKSDDWFYLTLHQIYCWRTLNRAAMVQLGIHVTREMQLSNLEMVLLSNRKLQFLALEWFSQFPTDQTDLLLGSNPDAANALGVIHIFLDKMNMFWPQLSSSCLVRKYPPSPYELYSTLGISSTVLQGVFFTFIFRLIEGGDDQDWINRAGQFFKFTQSQLIEKLHRVKMGVSEIPLNHHTDLAQFASEYLALRNRYASRPVFSAGVGIGQSTLHSPAVPSSGPFRPATTPIPAFATHWQTPAPDGRNSSNAIPPIYASQTPALGPYSGPIAGQATGTLQRTTSGYLPPSVNSRQPTLVPEQQHARQEQSSVVSVRGTTITNPERQASGLSTSASRTAANLQNLAHIPNASVVIRPQPESSTMNASHRPLVPSSNVALAQQTSSAPRERTRLLPLGGEPMTLTAYTNPDSAALHQAHSSSPTPSVLELGTSSPAGLRLFQVFQRFVLAPQTITNQQSYYEWQIDIPEADISRTAKDVVAEEHANRPSPNMRREFRQGSLIYRLRCIKLNTELNEAVWTTAPTYWPTSCFISLDSNSLELRRKSHWGKNLACDVTRSLKAGSNTIEMSIIFGPEEYIHAFAIAVEEVEVVDQLQCTRQLTLIEESESLAAIVDSLARATSDEEITVVDPHISIDLIDPFTAQRSKIPVRGKTCTHRECFDLQAFLDSRPTKHKDVPLSTIDDWKCPICNKDARPQCLVLDGFLLSVDKQLRAGSHEGEDVRAIQVTPDGLWKPAKVEKGDLRCEASSRDGRANTNSARSTPTVNAAKETILREARQESPVLIELDDD